MSYRKTIMDTLRGRYGDMMVESLDPRTPRWIEGWMRTESGTLDGLNREAFEREVVAGLRNAAAADEATNDSLADSWGIQP